MDYETLIDIHNLTEDLKLDLKMEIRVYHGECSFRAHLYNPSDKTGNMYSCLDKLLEELKELSKPVPKYKIGQTVWRLNDEYEPQSFIITDIDRDSDEMYLDDNEGWWVEEQLYPSKANLIEQQIIYWTRKQRTANIDNIHIKDFDKSTGLNPTILEKLARTYIKE